MVVFVIVVYAQGSLAYRIEINIILSYLMIPVSAAFNSLKVSGCRWFTDMVQKGWIAMRF